MRLLVACSACRRQFDASGLALGSRFHCTCGEILEAKAPTRGLDAAVVRCSACAATRRDDEPSCRHCGSDFTLHERDLGTVCPQCLARVSNHAKFCHHCGGGLDASPVEGAASELKCPACHDAPPLLTRNLGESGAPALECRLCGGLWLERYVVEDLANRAQRERHAGAEGEVTRPAMPRPNAATKWAYRNCPRCGSMMNRRNYARRSGVIIDACREDGVWFDADELHQLLAWIREGGLVQAKARENEEQAEQKRHDAVRKFEQSRDASRGGYAPDVRSADWTNIIESIVDAMFF